MDGARPCRGAGRSQGHPSLAESQGAWRHPSRVGHPTGESRARPPFDDTPAGYLVAAPGYVDSQYGGKKAALRRLFEQFVTLVRGLGPDVKVCPCETNVSYYRNHVFAEVKPCTSRLDLGLALGDPATVKDPDGRLQDTGGFGKKDRITHRIEITKASEIDDEVMRWLKKAYQLDV